MLEAVCVQRSLIKYVLAICAGFGRRLLLLLLR